MITAIVLLTIAAICAAGTAITIRVIDADDRNARHARDAHAHVMRLKHGNTWGAQAIRARLTVLRSIIRAAEKARPPSELRQALDLIGTLTSPAAPSSPQGYTGAEDAPGAAAAAGAPHLAPPPLLDYTDREPFANWESDTFTGMQAIRVPGDADWPLTAPREWHTEMERGM